MTTVKIIPNFRGFTIWNDNVGYTLNRTHSADKCEGRACILHNPTDHHMRHWPLLWNEVTGRLERQCPHGERLCDPDQYEFVRSLDDGGRLEPLCCGFMVSYAGPLVKCLACHAVIRSMHRHDFVTCGCGKTFVDGGSSYTRIGGPGVIVDG